MGTYITLGIIVSAYLCWLIFWVDVLESNKKKRKPVTELEEINLGGLLLGIALGLVSIVLWPFMLLMAIGMSWEEFHLGKLVIWKRTKDKDISLNGIDD